MIEKIMIPGLEEICENINNFIGTVYMIRNKIDDKKYIGITKYNFNKRYPYAGDGIERVYRYHKANEEAGIYFNKHLLKSIEKYGFEAFEVIEEFDVANCALELEALEIFYIHYYNTNDMKYGYNENDGGGYGRSFTERGLKKLSEANKGENNAMHGKVGELNPVSKKTKIIIDGKEIIKGSRSLLVKYIKENYGINIYGWFDRKYIPYMYKNRVSYCGYVGEKPFKYGEAKRKYTPRVYGNKFLIIIDNKQYIASTKKELNNIIKNKFGWYINGWFKRGVPKDKIDRVSYIGELKDYKPEIKAKCSNNISRGYILVVDGIEYKETFLKDLKQLAFDKFEFRISDWISRRIIPNDYLDRVSYCGTIEDYENNVPMNKTEARGEKAKRKVKIIYEGKEIIKNSIRELVKYMKNEYNITGVSHWFTTAGVPKKLKDKITYVGYEDNKEEYNNCLKDVA